MGFDQDFHTKCSFKFMWFAALYTSTAIDCKGLLEEPIVNTETKPLSSIRYEIF